MKFIITILFSLFVHFVGNAQNDTINRIDENEKKQGHWIHYGKDRLETHDSTDPKMSEGPYIDNRKEGIWTRYHDDGITPKLKGEYHNNRPSGAYTKYYKNGSIREQGEFHFHNYNYGYARYFEDGRLIENRTILDDEHSIDSFFHYFESNCLEKIEVYGRTDDVIETITYSEENCNLILHKKKSTISRHSHHNLTEYEFVYAPCNPMAMDTLVNPPTIIKDEREQIFTLNLLDSIAPPKPRYNRAWNFAKMYEYSVLNNDSVIENKHRVFTKGQSIRIDGYNKFYNVDDEIFIDGDFSKGNFVDGKVYIYDDDGILLKVKVFKKGRYFADGQL